MTEQQAKASWIRHFLEKAVEGRVETILVLDALELLGGVRTNIPQEVIDAWVQKGGGQAFPLIMEPRFFALMDMRFDDDALMVNLSFDKLYRCSIPYRVVLAVNLVFRDKKKLVPEDRPTPPSGPRLRLVTDNDS